MFILISIVVLNFFVKSKNFLLILLNFEFLILVLYSMLTFMQNNCGFNIGFPLYYLVFSVCESCLGLSLLIYIVRGLGGDYLKNLILLI